MKERSQIEEKYKWDLSEYCTSLDEWDNRLAKASKMALARQRFKGRLKDADTIFECLSEGSQISQELSVLGVFMSLKQKENALEPVYEEKLNYLSKIDTEIGEKTAFISSELNKLSNAFLRSLAKEKRFKNYKLTLEEIIRQKKHILSAKEEKLLASASDAFGASSDVFDMFDEADVKFCDVETCDGKKLPLDHSKYSNYMENSDRVLRKNTMKSMQKAYGDFNHTLSANYISNVKEDCFFAKIRKFSSALDESMFYENASEKVYQTLVKSVNKNLSVFHEYFDIKRKQLGVERFAIYDMYATPIKDLDKKISFEDAFKTVKNATLPLGENYGKLLDRAKKERWIDIYPNKGKDTGAFAWGAYGKHPVVLLNQTDNTNSLFTLAHELGHAMHSYHSNISLNYEDAGYTIFVAEVASNVNEMLLLKYLLKRAKTKDEKIYYFDHFLSMFRGSVFRQTMFAEFEEFAHAQYEKGQPISFEVLNNFYYGLNAKYFGEKVELIDEIKYEWSRIPHFYRSFYVYKYATGLICAITLAGKIMESENGRDAYIKFLSSGSTKPPIELLADAGADLRKPETFDYAFSEVQKVLDEWKQLL